MQVIALISHAAWYSFLTDRRVVSVAARRSTALALTPTPSNQWGASGAPGLRGRLCPAWVGAATAWSMAPPWSAFQPMRMSRSDREVQDRVIVRHAVGGPISGAASAKPIEPRGFFGLYKRRLSGLIAFAFIGGKRMRSAERRGLSMDDVLVTEGLSKSFGDFHAVSDVSLRVRRGTIHALIGPNGAGKTTCFNMLSKFIAPTGGRITFNGRDITNLKPADVARLGLVRSFQISAVFPHLTALENIRIALMRKRGDSFDFWRSKAALKPLNERALALLNDVGLAGFANSKAGEISYGRKRALELATTLAIEPEMMLLDEPMAGMGHEDIDRTADLIRRVSENRTILMVEHNLKVVANLSDRITVLTRGRVLAEGDYREVSENEEVKQAYLGVGHG